MLGSTSLVFWNFHLELRLELFQLALRPVRSENDLAIRIQELFFLLCFLLATSHHKNQWSQKTNFQTDARPLLLGCRGGFSFLQQGLFPVAQQGPEKTTGGSGGQRFIDTLWVDSKSSNSNLSG